MLKTILGAIFGAGNSNVKNVSVQKAQEVVKEKGVQFIDVRSVGEYRGGHAKKTVNMPLDSLAGELEKLDKTRPVYVICQSGMRSLRGASLLDRAGFAEVYNVSGGTLAWRAANLPLEK